MKKDSLPVMDGPPEGRVKLPWLAYEEGGKKNAVQIHSEETKR